MPRSLPVEGRYTGAPEDFVEMQVQVSVTAGVMLASAFGADLDPERTEHHSADDSARTDRWCIPAELEDLVEPALFGDARVGRDVMLECIVGGPVTRASRHHRRSAARRLRSRQKRVISYV
jgi:hypothetical protein